MVSIITVNYNGFKDTCDLIVSLKQFETYPHEIIVVDNASQGNDAKRIEQEFPDVIVLSSHDNLGFAGGNNLGYKYAKGDYIFFLNNDMVIKAPMLEPMVNRLKNGDYAGVSPCIVYLYKPERIQYYGYKDMTSITLKHTTESFNPLHREYFLDPQETEVLHGGAMMVRRDVIARVGVMTEIYFLFYEEFDWSRRLREAGCKLFYEPTSVVYHKESMTIKPQTPIREYYLARSRMIYARRNCKGLRKPLSCLYQCILVLPKKILHYMYRQRFDLVSAVWKGTFQGLVCSLK
ncbi:glycosyltransferase family 2 protein [Bacteroides oleiciplenus]|uniref:Glycosyltransferase family 2 protein n=1 Tax=Bacteroides oleiciplenus TaxID=626931 RepID=A0A3E5AYG2_9BACE|nr:glycosyltransferase family 2 protein [Bacteroides oleiciplenus]RGN30350.1 glycosyltransferase family 2 protein [Bacteroides oleiciplenus]